MKFKNKTNNSVKIEDINRNFSFSDKVEEINSDDVLKSRNFQDLIINGLFEIVEIDENSRIEKYLLSKRQEIKKENKIRRNEKSEIPEVAIRGHFYDNSRLFKG